MMDLIKQPGGYNNTEKATSFEHVLDNSGKENLSFNRKDPVAEPNSHKGSLPRPGGVRRNKGK